MRTLQVVTISILASSTVLAAGNRWAIHGNPVPVAMSMDATYGVTQKNPIRVGQDGGPFAEQAYLNSLRGPLGEEVTYERLGGGCCSFETPNGLFGKGLLDRYEVAYAGLEAPIILYLDMYDYERPLVPVGLSMAGAHFLPLSASDVFSGCGCSFRALSDASGREDAILFSSNYEGSGRIASTDGVIQLSGGRSDVECRPTRVGGECELKYRSEQVRVTVKVKATRVCPNDKESESCEVVRVQGQMSGRFAGRFSVFEETVDVHGECGC